MRRLLSIRRTVPDSDRSAYDALWRELENRARDDGFHAWRFRSAASNQTYVDFLEFAGEHDPRRTPAVRRVLDELASRFPGAGEEEWLAVAE